MDSPDERRPCFGTHARSSRSGAGDARTWWPIRHTSRASLNLSIPPISQRHGGIRRSRRLGTCELRHARVALVYVTVGTVAPTIPILPLLEALSRLPVSALMTTGRDL